MDDLLGEFLEETSESLDVVDVELVKFEQDPDNSEILGNIFRLVHTIKGTCGFLGLPRLGTLAHSAENLMDKYRSGVSVTTEGVSAILETIDRLKEILADLEQNQKEPEGSDDDLISRLDDIAEGRLGSADAPDEAVALAEDSPREDGGSELLEQSSDVEQSLERDLKPGEDSLDDLERAFQEADGLDDFDIAPGAATAFAAEAGQSAIEEEVVAAATKKAKAKKASKKASGAGAPAKSDAPVKTQSIRVTVDTLEHLMTMVSELVLTRNQLLEIARQTEDNDFVTPLQRLSTITAELQEGVMKTRMQPIGNAWQKLPRIVRDLSRSLDKKIDLEMIGAETELDRQVLDLIKDPLTHMVRNSADHGLEETSDRMQIGKQETGKITLSAYHEGGQIVIKIADDGQGIDADRIGAKAVKTELVTQDELDRMSENQIQKLVFHPGLSTAKEVTSVSGRGVGMDVVRINIELIGGTVDLKSQMGVGTTFTIKIPLTLAIISALIVETEGQRYAIPQLSVIELVRASANSDHRIEMINDTPLLRLRNKLLPVVKMSALLKTNETGKCSEETDNVGTNDFVIVTQVGSQTFGIVVDGVFHTEEIVVKPMSNMLRDITMFSGNTILGDGSVIMIIDPNGVAQHLDGAGTEAAEEAEKSNAIGDEAATKNTALLIFRAGSEDPKAVPLSLVTRLEEIERESIEISNDRELVQYRGSLMPLVRFESDSAAASGDKRTQSVLVFTDASRSMGLAVDEIVDIVDERLNIEIASEEPGVLGSAVIRDKATEIIDIGHYLPQAYEDWMDAKDREVSHVQRDLNLLLVDDSAFFRNMLAPLLTSAGYNVTLAESAEAALEIKEKGGSFDLIVSDIEMPGMDGIAFAEKLQEDKDWGQTPIIALSSHAEPKIIERSRNAGFHDYVGKFDRKGLIESLNECKSRSGVAA